MVFSDLMSQTTQRASGPNAATGTGGVNARQIGLGVKTGAININITGQGSSQSTGNPFDIMITGENFFVVNNGTQNFFTRDGSFYVDAAGNLAMTSTGYNVMGWQVDETTMQVKKDTVSALRIMSAANLTYPPEATSEAHFSGIIDKNDTDVTSVKGRVVNLNFYDNLGYSYTARFIIKKGDSNPETETYSVELDKLLDSVGNEIEIPDLDAAGNPTKVFGDNDQILNRAGKIVFDDTNYKWDGNNLCRNDAAGTVIVSVGDLATGGALKAGDEKITVEGVEATVQDGLDAIAKAYGYEGSTDEFLNTLYSGTKDAPIDPPVSIREMIEGSTPTTLQSLTTADNNSFATSGVKFNGTTITFNANTGYFSGINGQPTVDSVKLNLADVLGGNFSNINIDFSQVTQFDNKGTCTVGATSGDLGNLGTGRRLGKMIGVSIQQNGEIYASYDSGMTKCLGQIATASFPNASGLEKNGDNLYSATLNSGEFDGVGVDITAGGGYMSSGMLEMSNVDLSSEFTEMITTQRGFQANSRIITVSDTLLEELTNLKR